MSIDKNNDMFTNNKQSVDLGHTFDPEGQASELPIETQIPNAKEKFEQELLKHLSKEKHRLAAEMEIKFKEASIKRIKAQEQKYKQLLEQEKGNLEQEKENYEKVLKDKYNRVMKSMLQDREQKIAEEYKKQYIKSDVGLRSEIDKLKRELEQQQKSASLQITEAKITAKKEQEDASRGLYDNLIQASRSDIVKQTEERLQAEFLHKEIEFKREHEINLKKHTAKLMNSYEAKLNEALFEQEQALARSNSEQLSRQSELFNYRIQQEVESAVAAETSKLELEFIKEKQALNSIIENLRPEIEANRMRMRVEVEKELREEFEVKFAQYRQKVDQAKMIELEALLTSEKQRLAEDLQAENMVVMRYKEREIREGCNAELHSELQAKVHTNLQEQEIRLRAEFQQQIEQLTKKLQNDHTLQLQAEVIQERARVSEKATSEKKILLQQQETNLQEKFASEIAHKLAMQAQSLVQQHQIEIKNLQEKLQAAQSQQSIKQAYEKAIAVTQAPIDLGELSLVSARQTQEYPKFDHVAFEAEKQNALRAQEQRLRAEFAQEMRAAKASMESEPRGIDPRIHEEELLNCEQKLRREFQAILEQQRLQAATSFAKQRDLELRSTITRFKQKIQNEMETARVNDIAATEEALKEQYAARMQQHGELAKVEVERFKEQLIAEHADKIKVAVDVQMEVMRKDQDRKFAAYAQIQDEKMQKLLDEEKQKINLRFAQDKANLIKDLTTKFTREKHIAMNKYETELREKLYREMVKQKDFIQSKFTHAQESALSEQKRRLESQHKHEIERIKQGFFDPDHEEPKHEQIIAERSVEQLADKILAKFQKQS